MTKTNKEKVPEEILSSITRMMQANLDPERQAVIKKSIEKDSLSERKLIHDSVNEIKNKLATFPPEIKQLTFSFLPHDMTRVSPFYPMSRAEMGHRPFEKQLHQNSWGTIEIQGERLAIHDESVLLAVLKLAKIKKGFSFSTSYNEILNTMGMSVGKNPYQAVKYSLDRLVGTSIKLTITSKNNQPKTGLTNTILSGVVYKEYNIQIGINPYFCEMYLANLITSIDIDFRATLKGDITKSLYRFYEGQSKEFERYPISIDKLCDAINLDKTQPKYYLRRLIKKALKELVSHKFFDHAEINSKDEIVVMRSPLSIKSFDN